MDVRHSLSPLQRRSLRGSIYMHVHWERQRSIKHAKICSPLAPVGGSRSLHRPQQVLSGLACFLWKPEKPARGDRGGVTHRAQNFYPWPIANCWPVYQWFINKIPDQITPTPLHWKSQRKGVLSMGQEGNTLTLRCHGKWTLRCRHSPLAVRFLIILRKWVTAFVKTSITSRGFAAF